MPRCRIRSRSRHDGTAARRSTTLLCAGWLLALTPTACSGRSLEERAGAQVAAGAAVYQRHCAACHEGEGPRIGPTLSPEAVAGYGDAKRLFDYLRATMPYGAAGTLAADEYWATVAYLAASRDLWDPTAPLGAGTADTVTFAR